MIAQKVVIFSLHFFASHVILIIPINDYCMSKKLSFSILSLLLISLFSFSLYANAQSTGGSCAFKYTGVFRIGYISADVRTLQRILNRSSDTAVAIKGAGSPGLETTYFGAKTNAALTKFRKKYGISANTPISRKKLTEVCGGVASAPNPPVTPVPVPTLPPT